MMSPPKRVRTAAGAVNSCLPLANDHPCAPRTASAGSWKCNAHRRTRIDIEVDTISYDMPMARRVGRAELAAGHCLCDTMVFRLMKSEEETKGRDVARACNVRSEDRGDHDEPRYRE